MEISFPPCTFGARCVFLMDIVVVSDHYLPASLALQKGSKARAQLQAAQNHTSYHVHHFVFCSVVL